MPQRRRRQLVHLQALRDMVAGVFGALTVNRKILFVQAVPAAVAVVVLAAG